MTSALIKLLILFVPVVLGIVALVFGILLALSYLRGWGTLARTYAATPETNKGELLEEKLPYKAWVGLNTFGISVTARSFERGLELAVRFPFSPPLFFPWDEIHDYGRVTLIPLPQMDQFSVNGQRIRLANHMDELGKRKG